MGDPERIGPIWSKLCELHIVTMVTVEMGQTSVEKELDDSPQKANILPVYLKCPQCDGCGNLNEEKNPVHADESGKRLETSAPCPSCAGFGKYKDPREFAKKILQKNPRLDHVVVDACRFRNFMTVEFPSMKDSEIDEMFEKVSSELQIQY